MKKSVQAGVAVGLVVGAVVVVGLWGRGGDSDMAGAAGDGGHDHAAMLAGLEEAQAVSLSTELLDRTGITYARVERRTLVRGVKALGRIVYDETRLADVSPKLDGWAEELYVDFTGAPVERGEPLLELYSPLLVAAQEELILAVELAESATPGTRHSLAPSGLLESARRRLAYWDVPDEVIRDVEESREVRRTVPLLAPASGVVVEKSVVEGGRVSAGGRLYRIADLSRVWIEADVFERDLSLVSLGEHAIIGLEAYPGEVFEGLVTYVYPTLNENTRTGTVRVELPNPQGRIRPGMFATLEFSVPTDGPVLLVPRGAVLATGERSLVYVRQPDGSLIPREVVTGLAAGQEVEILAGLMEGDVVVSSASFLIDAESNLGSAAMNPGVGGGMGGMEGGDPPEPDGSPEPPDTAGADPVDHSAHSDPQG